MLKLQALQTSHPDYQFTENLFLSSFPQHERRDIEKQRYLTDNKPIFSNNIIQDEEGEGMGFVSLWTFPEFIYIEHFAIATHLQGKGIGRMVLEAIKARQLPIVLEVECPENEMAEKRIKFYENSGFSVWTTDYQQPPYRKGDAFYPMYLMLYGNLSDMKQVKKTLYKEVYEQT